MRMFWQDLRYGARMLAKSPGFTAVAILTLALGIGANSAIFSVINAVLLKPLPYPEPNRLVVLDEYQLHTGESSVAWMNFLDWRDQNKSFEDMAAYRTIHLTLTGAGEPALLRTGQVSAAFFPLIGTKTILGRSFSKPEDNPEAGPTVVLSYNFWRNRLGGEPDVVGKTITLDGTAYSAIGVLAPGFNYFNQTVDIYVPIGLKGKTPSWLDRVNHPGLLVLARLKPGVSLASARSEMDTIMRRLEQEYPKSNSGERASIVLLYSHLYGDVQPAMFTLLAAVGLVLLIACANVANLLLARAASRQREFAVRAAIGASRTRVIRQLLTESMLLSSIGGVMGLLLASWMIGPLLRIAPPEIPRLADTQVNLWVFLFTLGVSVITGILFGLVPALQTSNLDLNRVLKESGHSTSGPARDRFRAALFISEVALASVLVIASGLLIRSLWKAQNVNPGFNADHVLALDVLLPRTQYKTDAQILNFFNQATEKIRNLPGVRSASAVYCPPVVGTCWTSVYLVEGRPVPPQDQLADSVFNAAEPDYFRTMEIPLIEGRSFKATDTAQSPPVIIINQSMARRWWPNESPLGKRIKQGFPQSPTPYREIVGVVGDVKQEGPDAQQLTEIFLPPTQNPDNAMTLVVRTSSDPLSLAATVEEQIHALDSNLPVARVQPMTQYFSEALARRRFSTLLLGIFGALALVLAAVGIYGVMAYSVAQRTHEIGIRVALGAQRGGIIMLVVGQGLRFALLGVAIGLTAAFVLTRWMASLLFGVTATDPATFAAVAAVLTSVALPACYVPARRAMKVDPMVALRYE